MGDQMDDRLAGQANRAAIIRAIARMGGGWGDSETKPAGHQKTTGGGVNVPAV
jgi:hypothetical protein